MESLFITAAGRINRTLSLFMCGDMAHENYKTVEESSCL